MYIIPHKERKKERVISSKPNNVYGFLFSIKSFVSQVDDYIVRHNRIVSVDSDKEIS
jgi:hypothetical protein